MVNIHSSLRSITSYRHWSPCYYRRRRSSTIQIQPTIHNLLISRVLPRASSFPSIRNININITPSSINTNMKTTRISPLAAIALSLSTVSNVNVSAFQVLHTAPLLSLSSFSRRTISTQLEASTLDTDTTSSTATTAQSDKTAIITEAEGQVLSIYHTQQPSSNNSKSFAVIKLCEEEIALPKTLSAGGVAGDNVPLVDVDIDSSESETVGTERKKDKEKKGALIDGDLTGRTVKFSNSSQGLVVTHRHPIAFVLLDSSSSSSSSSSSTLSNTNNDSERGNDECTISNKMVSINPASIPAGSIVDYMGNHVSVLHDGKVCRSLPKAASTVSTTSTASSSSSLDITQPNNNNNIGINDISLSVNANNINQADDGTNSENNRPIFVPIPKISDIGLIDSPLVTGITAIDALTPIGKGQNMLVIGDECSVNKRGWVVNLLRNVIHNHKDVSKNDGDDEDDDDASIKEGNQGGSGAMRCYYGLTSGDNDVRSRVVKRIQEAGIDNDIVTVVSNHDSSTSTSITTATTAAKDQEDDDDDDEAMRSATIMEAAEAVVVAATACTLGEHHALTTGGDAVVIIDDINSHKSLWDITTRELVKVYGEAAVVEADLQGGSSSEMRGFFSSLIQRAARFKVSKGGGSVTLILLSTIPDHLDEDEEDSANNKEDDEPTFEAADFDGMSDKIKMRIDMLIKAKVPLTATNLRKIDLPIPRPSKIENAKRLSLQHIEDLISMSDGQVWFDEVLAQQGRSPPLDPSRSLTRVGIGADTSSCRADAPALRSVVGSLRFDFQQAMDVIDATPTAGDVKTVQRRDGFLLAMHQNPNEARRLSQECIALLAASRGYLDGVLASGGLPGSIKGMEAMEGLMAHVEKEAGAIMFRIDSTLDLSLDERSVLEEVIADYFSE